MGNALNTPAADGRAEWLRRLASLAPLLAAAATFAVYLRTLAPTITWEHAGSDSGDLVTAAINLGVPHPTGYPLYTLITHAFTRLPGLEPARAVNLLSALSAAAGVGVSFWTVQRWLVGREDAGPGLAMGAAACGAGLVAFGGLLWSQATIAEVYSLQALIVALWWAVALHARPGLRPYLLSGILGLGLAHHATVVWLLPCLWPFLPTLWRWCSPRRLLALVACLAPGLLLYTYIPLRASAQPVPNWGSATTWARFVWLVTARAYRPYLRRPTVAYLWPRLRTAAGILIHEPGPLGLALALLGLWRGWDTQRRWTLAGLTYLALLSGHALLYGTDDAFLYLIPALWVVALWIGKGAVAAVRALEEAAPVHLRQPLVGVALLLIAGLPLGSLAVQFQGMDLHADRQAYDYALGVLEAAEPQAVVLCGGDDEAFSLWYLRYGLGERPDVAVVERNLLAFAWYRQHLAAVHPDLEALTAAQDDRSALTTLVQDVARDRPVQTTQVEGFMTSLASWEVKVPLSSFQRP